jgi:hypothetical protein
MARPKTPVPHDILDAVAEHLAARHPGIKLDLDEIGKGSRSTALRVVWHDGPGWTEAWFVCRRCPAGFDRYLVDVDRDQPTHRILPLVEAHFADDDHPAFRGLKDLGTRAHPRQDQLALYVPPRAEDGASLLCQTCKQMGRNPVMLTQLPYGDARRLRLVQRRRTDLGLRMHDWCSQDKADTLNALDQDLITHPDLDDARAALARARTPVPRRGRTRLNDALTLLLDRRTDQGEPIDAVITELALLSETNPVDFACQVGEALISLGVLADEKMHPRDFADQVRRALELPEGRHPTTSRRTLYRRWRALREASPGGGDVVAPPPLGEPRK